MIFGVDMSVLSALLGAVFFILVGVSSAYNVYAASIHDGLFGRILYQMTVFTCVAGLAQVFNGSVSDNTFWTICWLFALRTTRNAYLNWSGHYATK